MGIHYYDLQIASLIQERHTIPLEECSTRLHKSISSIKRSIGCVNEYLPREHQILITNNQAIFQMSYREYLLFIHSLSLEDYYPSQSERLDTMVIYSFLNTTLNMTHLYKTLYISLSTKKKDSRVLSDWLQTYELFTEVVPKAGIKITGNELQYRILVSDIISKNVELDRDFRLTMRQANNPLQRMITEYILVKAESALEEARQLIQRLIDQHHLRISYGSVKFLYLYLGCAIFRRQSGWVIQKSESLSIPVKDYQLLPDFHENRLLNHIISALDFATLVLPPENEGLLTLTKELITVVQEHIITWICDDHCIYEEIYTYLHKCVIRNTFHFSFYDNKLEETRDIYNNLYKIVKSAVQPYEECYSITMSQFQISTLTLIFRKYINKNKLTGRNQKRLVIVTNSSMEKIGFFMEKLKLRVDVRLIDVININELYQLEHLDYDFLIVFSNRIAMLLEEAGYSCIKLHFYMTDNDFLLLEEKGFSTSKRKIKAAPFVQSIAGMDSDTLTTWLVEEYSDFFME